jgi:membrane protein DedA with SNARE-associated domain
MTHSFLAHYATLLIQHFGYAGLALGLIISTMGLFSSEVVLLLGGAAVRQGSLNLVAVVIIAVVAQVIGAIISYSIGRYGGVPLIERYGRYVLLSKHDLDRARRWFGRYGRIATLLGYCLPFIRGYVGYAAGIAEQAIATFTASALLGSLLWSALTLSLGYYLASHLAAIEGVIQPFSYALVLIVVAAIAYVIWQRLRERHA